MLQITMEKQVLHPELGVREFSDAVNYIGKSIEPSECWIRELSDCVNYNGKATPAPPTRVDPGPRDLAVLWGPFGRLSASLAPLG